MSELKRFVQFKTRRAKRKAGRVEISLLEFYSMPNAKDPDLVANCDQGEFSIAAREFSPNGFELGGHCLKVKGDELYERLIVYATVRQSLRDPAKVLDLKPIVKELGAYELHFWASVFVENYRRLKSRLALMRPAKAFKILYGLARS